MFGNFIGTLAGGGGLITLPAMLLLGVPVHVGIGVNKFSGIIAGSSNIWRLVLGHRIALSNFIFIVAGGILSGAAGAAITTNLPAALLDYLVMVLLVFALTVSVIPTRRPPADAEEITQERFSRGMKAMSCGVGAYNGIFGPGAATLAIMIFMRRGFSYVDAVHHARLLVMSSSAGAFVLFLQHGFINWAYAIPLTIGSCIGAQLAFIVLPHISQKAAKIGLIIICSLLIIQTAIGLINNQ
jgi:uncharacterized membrane protein YfcA